MAEAEFAALASANIRLKRPFKLATGGWELGPEDDRSRFDRTIGPEYSAIGSQVSMVGAAPTDPGFRMIRHHEGWIGPWLEDDSMLIAPEIWVERTIKRAQVASEYGVSGALMGTHWRTRAVSPNLYALLRVGLDSNVTVAEVWSDWCKSEFGAVWEKACVAFRLLDANNCSESLMLHKVSHVYARPSCLRPAAWEMYPLRFSTGPEGSVAALHANSSGFSWIDDGQCAWRSLYRWVDSFCDIQSGVNVTATQRDALDYWCHSFSYMRALAAIDCAWALYQESVAQLNSSTDPRRFATEVVLPLRVQLTANVSIALTHLMQTISNVGEIGTLAHMLSSDLPNTLWNATEVKLLLDALGTLHLPVDAMPSTEYQGAPRVFVPTRRPFVRGSNQTVSIRAVVLSTTRPSRVQLWTRALAPDSDGLAVVQWASRPMRTETAKQQSFVQTIVVTGTGIEYYVSATWDHSSNSVLWPPEAPTRGENVLVWPDM